MSIFPSKKEFVRHQKGGLAVIPVGIELPIDTLTPIHIYNAIDKAGYKNKFILESADGGEDVGRYSYIGFSPVNEIKVKNYKLEFYNFLNDQYSKDDFSFELLDNILSQYQAPRYKGYSNIVGGTTGYVAYDAVKYIEDIPFFESPTHDIHLFTFRFIIVIDRLKNRVYIVYNYFSKNESRKYTEIVNHLEKIKNIILYSSNIAPLDISLDFDEKSSKFKMDTELGENEFISCVKKVKSHIRNGDIFQCVLSEKFKFKFECDPFLFYRVLRTLNPSPYLFLLDFGDEVLIGSSPEMLVKVSDGMIETSPIAGTRPRGVDFDDDTRLMKQLNSSVKEKAEHLMLVDLGRNDIGRVSAPGTVNVKRFMDVEKYSHVMHLVSLVEGKLKKNISPWKAFSSCFPAGTLSGAPKVRAMEIISELEMSDRSTYGGAVVFNTFHNDILSCITIRSLYTNKGEAVVQAGAGIVADSNPKKEYEEVMNKSKALKLAVKVTEELTRELK